ncbi:MAG TPA: ATP-binding protein [Vicinamibacterales bacterium]|jgi:two-component system NtrC family sensor kinase|nr:ATP-binding protein [Vicinamibacterales bacterium]
MSRDTGTRRLTRPAPPTPVGGARAQDTAPASLISLVANTGRLFDLLPALHQHALDAAGGTRSLLFEFNPRSGVLQATSGFGLDELCTDPWMPGPGEHALVNDAFIRRTPMLVADLETQMPELGGRLKAPAALLVALARGPIRFGLLTIGVSSPLNHRTQTDPGIEIAEVGDAFLATLELFRLRQKDELQRDLRELLDELGASLSSTLNLSAGLEVFCHGANRLFGADRTSTWIHDRRGRHLTLRASSDPEHVIRQTQVSVDDALAPAAVAMRRSRAEIAPSAGNLPTSIVTVPLRGTRRALGTIVMEGVRVETGDELDLLDRADELGRQLSSAVENMQLLDEVRQSHRELQNAFDSLLHLIVVTDQRGCIVHANEAFASRVKLTRDELLDRSVLDFLGPELGRWFSAQEQRPVRAEGEAGTTIEVVDPVLNGPFMVTATDLLDQNRQRVGSVLVARDMTPQTRIEAEREERRHRLTQSEKLVALGQFVAGIAHELNNPLQGVLGHLELLRATGAFPKQLRREVQTIYREADRAAKIVRNLLVFAGSRRLVRKAVSVNSVMQKVVALRMAACRAQDIELVRHYDDKLPRVQSDPLLLHQVFLNIVMNAEQAIAATGRPGRIEIATGLAGDRIVITVRDSGDGIPPDALSRIFEPFYTTKDVGKGTGLGLAIAYGIVQEHGGHIAAANHPEGGAVFTVELPAHRRRDTTA